MTPGDYEPFMDHTDDFPSIDVALHVKGRSGTDQGVARLYTESQGEFHKPWGASVAGGPYTSEGEQTGRALRARDRTLKRAELNTTARG